MPYQADETGLTSGRPIELYQFVGTYDTWRFTSYSETVTSNGEVYIPETISRNAFKVGTQEERENTLEITLPFDLDIVRNYAYQNAPPSLQLTIYRAHETDLNDRVTLWNGKVTAFTVDGRTAKLRVPSLFSYILEGNTPTPRFQAPCNHILYDERCGVDPSLHQHTTTVSSVVGDVVQVATLPFPTEVAAGVMIAPSGEQRMIITATGTSITLSYPFSTIENGTSVTIRKGCDHAFSGDCSSRFNNQVRFGGFPLVPPRNPFTSTF